MSTTKTNHHDTSQPTAVETVARALTIKDAGTTDYTTTWVDSRGKWWAKPKGWDA
ncbi:hypothetical protein GSY69_13680 [Brevibacterium sp. 5221]|uniref:Uncharacterized protein n=1 Tax=Brevibacterium rongguiense TaxID=2695267 RepID=A0A6N9HAA5_9MICO|nr:MULTISPECIES: hypothetical protein [Brevibacterium]MYM20978.1 hypothetical protein [Brevibacterium rongguiense]WAL39571.1 hypothetical protein BRM1_09870 [Brevibacterium sp. BRM-1]